jgi:hypothetical protein
MSLEVTPIGGKKKRRLGVPPLEWKKSHLKWSPISGEKKSYLKWHPLVAKKKKKTWSAPIGGEKRSRELIPTGVKRPTIGNEKKIIRCTPLDMTKIHLSDFTSTSCEKTFHLKGPDLLRNFIFHMNWPHWLEKKKITWAV